MCITILTEPEICHGDACNGEGNIWRKSTQQSKWFNSKGEPLYRMCGTCWDFVKKNPCDYPGCRMMKSSQNDKYCCRHNENSPLPEPIKIELE